MANINKIRLSGQTYNIEDANASKTVELTQAEYDALPASAKTSNSLFVITDAEGADLSNYYTKSETSGATEISTALNAKADTATTYTKTEVDTALGGKVNTSTYNTYTASTDTALASKQTTLTAGTGIDITDNVISATGGGGGKAVSGGTNISITTGETADTINCTLPISASSEGIYTTSAYPFLSSSNKSGNVVFGYNNRLDTFGSSKSSNYNLFFGSNNYISVNGSGMLIGGLNNINDGNPSNMTSCVILGSHNKVGNPYEFASGNYNITHFESASWGNSGNTLFSVGNGTLIARHNAFEIRQNGDIYIVDTNDTSTSIFNQKPMIKLQDQLGGSSITVDTALDSGSTNPVENRVIYNKIDEVEQVTARALNELNEEVSEKQNTLVSGTNIKTINNESILGSGNIDIQGGGGKAIEAGRGISITTGETADTVSFNLPISAGTGTYSIIEGNGTKASGVQSHAEGFYTTASGSFSHAEGTNTTASGSYSHAEGGGTTAIGSSSHAEGHNTKAYGEYGSHAEGQNTNATNESEHASGKYNVSNKANTTWGDSGNTLFSVGNGTAENARHNAFEIRQNGDIYLTKDGQDVKLQDQLGGGGSSYTAGDGIDITNDVISVTGKTDTTTYNTYTAATNSRLSEDEEVTAAALNNINNRLSEDEEVTAARLNALNDAFGGLKLMKISQTGYDNLQVKDQNTLYIIVN